MAYYRGGCKSTDVQPVKTDAQGVATWGGLDPHAVYRWGLLTAVSIDLEPPHEQRRYELKSDGSIEVGKAPPIGLSGKIRSERINARISRYS